MDAPHPDDAQRFARACLSVQYLLGRRGSELQAVQGVDVATQASCETLVKHLSHAQRDVRARALAAEVALLARALDRRGLT